jgi:2-enoate reductase
MLPKIGMDIGASERFITITKLKEKGVHLNTGVTVTGINEEAVIGTRASETLTFVADQVVVAAGMKKNNAINNTIGEVYAIGDCVEPRRIGEAVKEGYKIGLRI